MLKIVFWQLMVIIMLAVIIFLLQGMQKGISALLGGLTYWLPTLIFVWRVTKHAGAHAATRFIVAFFTWETVKLFLSGALFILVIKYLPAELLYALTGFVGAVVAFWVVSVISLFKNQGAKA